MRQMLKPGEKQGEVHGVGKRSVGSRLDAWSADRPRRTPDTPRDHFEALANLSNILIKFEL
jgi:hypothetical protein